MDKGGKFGRDVVFSVVAFALISPILEMRNEK